MESNEAHYYQNQLKFDNNIYFNQQTASNMRLSNSNFKKAEYYNKPYQNLGNASLQQNLVSSSSSTQTQNSTRALIVEKKELAVSYCLLFIAILCLVLSIVGITVTFIFPFWIKLSFQTEKGSQYIFNVTNLNNNVSLIDRNLSSSSRVEFELGIWEVKMHQNLEFYDLTTHLVYKNSYPQSMLWLNSDLNNQIESFLVKLLQFIDLKQSNLFAIQILEIIHLIFTFLTLCFTSFTLCLCTNHKSSLCWYLVCFFMSLISFFTGLAVIILIVVWQSGIILPSLKNQITNQLIFMNKDFNWCFWLSVGINSLIVLSAFLILLYLLITTIYLYFRNKSLAAKRRAYLSDNQANRKSYLAGIDNPVLDLNNKLPRYQTGTSSDTTNNQPNGLNNPSYIFYTGHGNYRKQSIVIDDVPEQINVKADYEQTEFLNPHLINLTLANNKHQFEQHPYSNVAEQAQNEFRFTSYK